MLTYHARNWKRREGAAHPVWGISRNAWGISKTLDRERRGSSPRTACRSRRGSAGRKCRPCSRAWRPARMRRCPRSAWGQYKVAGRSGERHRRAAAGCSDGCPAQHSTQRWVAGKHSTQPEDVGQVGQAGRRVCCRQAGGAAALAQLPPRRHDGQPHTHRLALQPWTRTTTGPPSRPYRWYTIFTPSVVVMCVCSALAPASMGTGQAAVVLVAVAAAKSGPAAQLLAQHHIGQALMGQARRRPAAGSAISRGDSLFFAACSGLAPGTRRSNDCMAAGREICNTAALLGMRLNH